MSILCAAIKHGEVAIAADTQINYGTIKVRHPNIENCKKIFPVGDSIMGIVGWSAVADIMEHLVATQPELFKLNSRHEIYSTLLDIHEVMKEKYYIEPKEEDEQPVESSQAGGLVVNKNGIFEITSHRAVTQFNTFWARGSGQEIALGAMYVKYKDEQASAKDIVVAGVEAAAEFDDGCGLPVTSAVIPLAQ